MRFRKFRYFHRKIVETVQTPPIPENKGSAFNPKTWKLNRKEKILIAIILIAVILLPTVAFLPKGDRAEPQPTVTPTPTTTQQTTNTTPPPQSNPLGDLGKLIQDAGKTINSAIISRKLGPIEGAQAMNSSVWREVAANAWNYLRPGYGVNSKTGLPLSGNAYPYFTDWDLGVYIQATIDASKIGIITKDGAWGFNDRIDKVLTFCETRELDNASYPYWFYQSDDGGVFHDNSDVPNFVVDVADTGRLLVAYNNLRNYSPINATRINNLIYNVNDNRSNYEGLVPSIQAESLTSKSIYAYYVASGFASFWPEQLSGATSNILDNIYSSGTVTVNGLNLPQASLTSDVLLSVFFETPQNDRLTDLVNKIYQAHENYYQQTGKYHAFGEGSSVGSSWQWEWVVLSDGRTWTILDGANNVVNSSSVIYTKVAFGFLAVYNTVFAKNMSSYVEKMFYGMYYSYSNGYGEGVDEIGRQVCMLGIHSNGLILGASRYAIDVRP